MGADRIRGMYNTDQSLEVAQSIRNNDFTELTSGQHGYGIDESGNWVLSGTYITRYGYKTFMNIESLSDDKVRITARSDWKHGYHRSGATVLSIELTDWRSRTGGVGDWSNVDKTASIIISGTPPYFNDVTSSEDYAYVTSSSAGDGLYIFDVSDEANPFRVSNSFTLGGAAAHKPVVYRDTLYLAVEGSGDEVKAFDISIPTGLDAATVATATYDIPGDTNRATSLARKGSTLFVGAKTDFDESEFYALDISDPTSITLRDELDIADDPTIYDVYVRGDYAYLATDKDTQEIIVVDISNFSDLSVHSAYNATDVQDGYAVRATSTGFYLGRAEGSAIDEYLLITGEDGVPSSDPADTHGADMGSGGEGTVNAMDMDTLGCYTFIATDFSSKELQIRSARYKSVLEETYVDFGGDARGVHYDMMNDRLYAATSSGFHILTPGEGGNCL